MAFTERYVTAAAGGGGVGTVGDPWTLAEAFAAAVAGDRVNILSGAYSSGADAVDGVGNISQLVVFRGYTSTIGDLQNQGRTSVGALDTTNFPVITCTGVIRVKQFQVFQNIFFTASSLNSTVLGNLGDNRWTLIGCKVLNSTNNSFARSVFGDNDVCFIDCDISCTGASHNVVAEVDLSVYIMGCRFSCVADVSVVLANGGAKLVNNVFIGNSAGTGLRLDTVGTIPTYIIGNTFYLLDKAIEFPNAAMTDCPVIINNHASDCAEWIDYLYSATANVAVIEIANRTRDNTTPRTGVGDGVLSREVTTDTGGAATDYTDVATDNFHLIPDAPGVGTGLVPYQDIGGARHIPLTPAQIAEGVWTRAGRTLT